MNDAAAPPRSQLTLWLILAACVLPFVASTAMYYFWPRGKQMNYGELLQPGTLPDLSLEDLNGKAVPLSTLKGRWTLVHVDSGRCQTVCLEKMYKIRQVRLTQGKNMERVQRLWIISDNVVPEPNVLDTYKGTIELKAGKADIASFLPSSGLLHDHIWIIDPLGNVILRYEKDADPSG
jgi:cytochrome oxidase Cu insertion factor (SCO1/SenC/PrrC family)